MKWQISLLMSLIFGLSFLSETGNSPSSNYLQKYFSIVILPKDMVVLIIPAVMYVTVGVGLRD